MSIIPKSVHVESMQQNIDIWDFTLTEEEMAKIRGIHGKSQGSHRFYGISFALRYCVGVPPVICRKVLVK